jgi:citrate lyase beta subunit
VEDFRIDFEDGFGVRSDAEEDEVARTAGSELATALELEATPPFVGIRIKSLNSEWSRRAVRTLEIFLEVVLSKSGGRLPPNFVVTLPKVTVPEQPRTLALCLSLLERTHHLEPGTLRMEIMVETTQALLGADGRSPLSEFLEACEGRCTGAHLGTYDFTASCNITAAYQSMAHPMCDLARGLMLLAYAGRGIALSDGATNVLPIGPHAGEPEGLGETELAQNRAAVHHGWRLAHRNIRHSLRSGFYQGWDLHPAQLPVRYAATFAFFLEGFAAAAERLRNLLEKAAQATLVGDVFDDAATGQALLNQVARAVACGAVERDELQSAGLREEEIELRSFGEILEARARG